MLVAGSHAPLGRKTMGPVTEASHTHTPSGGPACLILTHIHTDALTQALTGVRTRHRFGERRACVQDV